MCVRVHVRVWERESRDLRTAGFSNVCFCSTLCFSAPPPSSLLSFLMLHNEIHPSQLTGVAVCCGLGTFIIRVCVCVGGGLVFWTGAWHKTNNCANVYTKWIQIRTKAFCAQICMAALTQQPQISHPTHAAGVFLFWEEEGLITCILHWKHPPPSDLFFF